MSMNVEYRQVMSVDMEEIKALYADCGWQTYLQDDEKLLSAYKNNLLLYGAYLEDKLIGFIRCVGDGEHVVLVQDLLVHSSYRRQGIGSKLFTDILTLYSKVRMVLVVTDKFDESNNLFYRKHGLVNVDDKKLIAYTV